MQQTTQSGAQAITKFVGRRSSKYKFMMEDKGWLQNMQKNGTRNKDKFEDWNWRHKTN
jgi:hypothetical protein